VKRLVLVLFTVLGLLIPLCGGSPYPRHIDPSLLDLDQPDPDTMFLLYHEIYQGMIYGQFELSKEFLMWAYEIHSTPSLEQSLLEYNTLLEGQVENLNLSSVYFNLAFNAVKKLELNEAKYLFLQGMVYLGVADSQMPSLYDKTDSIGTLLKTTPGILYDDLDTLQSKINEYYQLASLFQEYLEGGELSGDELEFVLNRVEDLGAYFKEIVESSVNLDSLSRTTLSLEINQSRVLIGSKVNVSGVLDLRGEAAGRQVRLILNNKLIDIVETDKNGFFNTVLQVPYIYDDYVAVWAEYWPEGDDVNRYLPSRSNVVIVELLHFEPELEVNVAEVVLPGENLTVWGKVTYNDVPLLVNVSASLLGANTTGISSSDGMFSLELGIPSDALVGICDLVVRTHPLNVYGSSWVVVPVEVKRYPVEVNAFCSGVVFSGMMLRAVGVVSAEGVPLDGCQVRLVWGGEAASTVTEGGKFDVGVRVPFWVTSQVTGLRLEILPKEAYIDEDVVILETRIINIGSLIAFLSVLASAVYFMKRKTGQRVKPSIPTVDSEGKEEASLEPVEGFVSLYARALLVVKRITGLDMRASETIREYLHRVKKTLSGGVYSVFEELSLLYERWLYGKPFELSLEWFRSLVNRIVHGKGDEE